LRRPGDSGDDFRALLVDQAVELALEASEAARRHVVARAGGNGRGRFEILLELARFFARESLVHPAFDHAAARALHSGASFRSRKL